MKARTMMVFLAIVALALGLAGCDRLQTETGEMRDETESVPLGTAGTASVEIEFAAGELNVAGGAAGLMDGSFRYNVDDWQPIVDYSESNGRGDLLVTQPDRELVANSGAVNVWNLQLNDDVPLELAVQIGAAESEIDLSTVDVTAVTVEAGAGNTSIDLTGDWQHDLDVTVSGGVGNIIIDLPAGMGVEVKATPALGGVTANGLNKSGDTYTNDSFGTASYNLTLELEVGVGSITMNVVD